jgi:hypothetical protein
VISVAGQSGADPAETERVAVERVKQRLADQFSGTSPDQVHRAVDTAHQRFDGAKIRDFVPIFVERSAVEELRRGA